MPTKPAIQPFENIVPWGTTGGDTGLSARLKLQHNFEHIKTWIDALDLGLDEAQVTAIATAVATAAVSSVGSTLFLSKTGDDTAAGKITFEDVAAFLQGLKLGGADARYGITGEGIATLLSLVFDGILKSKDAVAGFLDGHGITIDAATGKIVADGMEVRGFLKVMELVINRLQLMESDYSFTEGDTTERIDFTNNGQRMVLTMHKEHDNDHTPFYPGDILYAKINDLLDHGTYYTCWVRVVSIDQANNTIKVVPYGGPSVSGAKNFTFLGTEIDDADFLTELQHDYELYPDGYEKILSLTRHGNVADGLLDGDDPSSYSDEVKKSQQARQQSWVLSTTDKRLSFFWNVDEPIVRDENYALCLGILPDLANLPSTRDKTMPSLYVNTIFYDNQYRANYPARVIKEDRGQWVRPDSTVPQPTATTADGEVVYEPYHYRSFTRVTWLLYRNNPSWARLSDDELRQKMMLEFKVDLEVSRVWHHGCLWECLTDETSAEPGFTPQAWKMVSGKGWWVDFQLSQAPVVNLEDVSLKATPVIMLGDDDVSAQAVEQSAILAVTWTRHGNADGSQTAADELWQPTIDSDGMTLLIDHRRSDASRRTDCGPLWETLLRVAFVCKVTLADGSTQETELLIA